MDKDEISQMKDRMDAIANTRPGTLALSEEYATLQRRVVQLEVAALALHNKECACRLTNPMIAWDLRTDNIQVVQDASANKIVTVAFAHASNVRETMSLTSKLIFTGVEAFRSEYVSFTDSEGYVLGIVGIDNVGLFEVFDSLWMCHFARKDVSGLRHFCIVFANIAIEVLATSMQVVTTPE